MKELPADIARKALRDEHYAILSRSGRGMTRAEEARLQWLRDELDRWLRLSLDGGVRSTCYPCPPDACVGAVGGDR